MVGGAAMYLSENIVENAVNPKDHTRLVAAVYAAGLVTTLEVKGPFTLFFLQQAVSLNCLTVDTKAGCSPASPSQALPDNFSPFAITCCFAVIFFRSAKAPLNNMAIATGHTRTVRDHRVIVQYIVETDSYTDSDN